MKLHPPNSQRPATLFPCTTLFRSPVPVNDPALTARAHDSLVRAAGPGKVIEVDPITGAEDFADYANLVPSVFFFVGATPPDRDMKTVASNQDRKSTRLNSSH